MSYIDLGFNQFLQRQFSDFTSQMNAANTSPMPLSQIDPAQFDLLTNGQEIDIGKIINDKRFVLMDSVKSADLQDMENGDFQDVDGSTITFTLPDVADVTVYYDVDFVMFGMVAGWFTAANYQLNIDGVLLGYPQRNTDVKQYDGVFNGNTTRRLTIAHSEKITLTQGPHTIKLQAYITRSNLEVLRTILCSLGYIAVNQQ